MAASTASNLLPCLFLIITHKGNRFQVVPGQKVIIPRAHLLTTRKRAEVLPDGSRALSEAAVRSPRGTLQRAHVLLVAPKLGAVKGPASVLPASVLYGGQEGLKPLSFKMCAFQGEKPLTNRLLVGNGIAFPIQGVVLAQAAV